jgi:hypothetical protein
MQIIDENGIKLVCDFHFPDSAIMEFENHDLCFKCAAIEGLI